MAEGADVSDIQETINAALRLAENDEPLEALALLAPSPSRRWQPYPLWETLIHRTAHLQSHDAYAAFYNEPAPERPYLPEEHLQVLHLLMERWAVVRGELLRQGVRTVLELGCFDGFCLLNLAMTNGIASVGVDVNLEAVREANRRAEKYALPVHCIASLIETCELEAGAFDAVLCLEVLEHVINPEAVLSVAERACAPNGRIYVSAPLTAPRHVHERERREHVRLFTGPRMVELLTCGGRELAWYQRLRTQDGLHHCGAYEVRR